MSIQREASQEILGIRCAVDDLDSEAGWRCRTVNVTAPVDATRTITFHLHWHESDAAHTPPGDPPIRVRVLAYQIRDGDLLVHEWSHSPYGC